MSDTHGVDVLEGIARMNPVPDDRLDHGRQIRSEVVLARIVGSGGRWSEATEVDPGNRSGAADAAVSVGMHVSRTAALGRGHAGPARVMRGLAIALASVLGLGAAAYATGVTPGAVEIGRQVLEGADNGTVTYSYAPAEAGSSVMGRMAASAASSSDLGDPSRVIQVHTLNQVDGWESVAAGPVSQRNERWDWMLLDGSRRVRSDGVTGQEGIGSSLEYPPEGNEDVRAINLGTSAESAIAQLRQDDRPERSSWAVVDRYVQLWGSGLGLRASDRAAFLRALGAIDYTYYGPATDSLGREGQAFGVSWSAGDATHGIRVVLDPANGAVLASESALHGPWILGSKDRVESSATFVSEGNFDSLAFCDETPGCTVMPPPG